MPCLDTREIGVILIMQDNPVHVRVGAEIIAEMAMENGPNVESNFDCYLPFNERRDYVIKQYLKDAEASGLTRLQQMAA